MLESFKKMRQMKDYRDKYTLFNMNVTYQVGVIFYPLISKQYHKNKAQKIRPQPSFIKNLLSSGDSGI